MALPAFSVATVRSITERHGLSGRSEILPGSHLVPVRLLPFFRGTMRFPVQKPNQ